MTDPEKIAEYSENWAGHLSVGWRPHVSTTIRCASAKLAMRDFV